MPKTPYTCPRCGYAISHKGSMRTHMYTLKKKCPATVNDIDLTDEIKTWVLENRVYKEAITNKVLNRSHRQPPTASCSIVHVDTSMKPQVPSVVLRVFAVCEYVYIIYVREFMMRNEPVYKLGKTTQKNVLRASSYPKGSVLLLQVSCRDCTIVEQELMKVFKDRYQQCTEYGLEYFKGKAKHMMADMFAIVERLDDDEDTAV